MTVGDALGNAGADWAIDHDGKTYRARLVTQRVKDAFSAHLSQRVLRQFLALQQDADGAFDQAVGVVADRIALGRYDFHGPVAQQALQTPEGVFRLACLVFDVEGDGHDGKRRPVTDGEMTGLLAGRGKEVNAVMKLVFARSFPKPAAPPPEPPSGEEGADPNPQGSGGVSSPRPQPGASSTPASSTSPSS